MTNTLTQFVGFGDPVHDSQRMARMLIDAMARPGVVFRLPVALEAPKIGFVDEVLTAALLALADRETPLALCPTLAASDLGKVLSFRNGVGVVVPQQAVFAAAADAAGACALIGLLPLGTAERPEESATLFVAVTGWSGGGRLCLDGPGIDGSLIVSVNGPSAALWTAIADTRDDYPRGVDVVFTCGRELMTLPRSTRITLES